MPDPRPLEGPARRPDASAVEIESPEICPFYSARVIRGVRIGPSPGWLVDRLRTVGVASVNNVVDVTNYVMLECGPAAARLRSGQDARRPDHRPAGRGRASLSWRSTTRRYTLDDRMCVIADAERPVALAGVMGGADSEISAATVDVLLESAQFAPLPVRAAARGLVLASGSIYRFERGPDPAMVDWASRRAAALILELAGGVLDRGVVTAGELASSPATITLAPRAGRRRCSGSRFRPTGSRKSSRRSAFGRQADGGPAAGRHRPGGGTAGGRSTSSRRSPGSRATTGVPEDVPIAATAGELSDREAGGAAGRRGAAWAQASARR